MKRYIKTPAGLICILSLSLGLGKANAQVTFNYTGSVQTWTVPNCTTNLTISATGAGGGGSVDEFTQGGSGATIIGVVPVTQGDSIVIIVGKQGTTNPGIDGGAGGGGTFIYDVTSATLLEVAGAGGGAYWIGSNGFNASTTTTPTGNSGGSGELGGGSSNTDAGGGGAGFLGNGASTYYSVSPMQAGQGGNDFANGFAGGAGDQSGDPNVTGGYGGGGGAGYDDGGGGGGYNGGGSEGGPSGNGGGGGSSYVNGSMIGSSVSNMGDGSVMISWTPGIIPVTDTGKVISHVTCNGANNGIATALVTGGTPSTYTYSWAPGGQTTDMVSGLSNGTYTITVNNSCGGSATSTVTITQPVALSLSGNIINDVSCNGGNNGAASATVGGGTMPYTYSWTSGSTRDTANGLSAGFYKITITDKNGCSLLTSISITQPNALIASANNTANAHCGISNGSASSTVGGGVAPYTYSWTGGSTSSSISGLSGGTYILNVTDNKGCMATSSVILTETPAVFSNASNVSNVTCNGGNDGSALSRASGGMAPFTYLWSNGETNFSAPGLTAGTYTIEITDANGCSSSSQTTITQPTAINVVVDTTVDIGKCTGSAWVIVSGGVLPYSYLWSNGNTTFEIANECKGNYCCTITDGNGCTKQVCVHITSVAGVNSITSNAGQIRVYPNPNSGVFELGIRNYEVGNASIEVYNVLGEKVYSTNLNSPNGINTVNMGNQPNGVYLYRVLTGSGNLLGDGKIIVQK